MTVRRLALSAALVASAGGCAASRGARLSRPDAIAQAPLPAPAVAEVVARHNQNAAMVNSLFVAPVISAKFSRMAGGLSGNMVFERPHNFRLVVKGGSKKMADLGSNDDEFWFWGDDRKDNGNVYVCRYDAASTASTQQLPFQPDWIVEALGLREIPADEVPKIEVKAGPSNRPGTVAWVHTRPTARGDVAKKMTIIDRNTGAIVEHRFYLPGSATPIAVATPSGSTDAPLADEPGRTVRLPAKIHLSLASPDPRDSGLEMDLVLKDPKVNEPIEGNDRTALFSVPAIAGTQPFRLDGSDADGAASATAPRARPRRDTRQSAAPPESGPGSGSGASLGDPAPLGVDDAHLRRSDPMPLEPDLGRGGADRGGVVGMPVPQPPENPAERMSRRESIPYPQ